MKPIYDGLMNGDTFIKYQYVVPRKEDWYMYIPPDLDWLYETSYDEIEKSLHRVETPSLYNEELEVIQLKQQILNYLGI